MKQCLECDALIEKRERHILPYLGRYVQRTGDTPHRLLALYRAAMHHRYSHGGAA